MRKANLTRKTKETEITAALNLDGKGLNNIETGVGFFNHMLQLFATHGNFDLDVTCKGDTHVDAHHSVEDVGIVLGNLIKTTLGDKAGIARYATMYVPMDEALARVVIDLSGRAHLSFEANLKDKVGEFDSELTEEFFKAVVSNAQITAHITVLENGNSHHTIEAIFKAFARALAKAVKIVGTSIPSSKGIL